MKILIKKFRKGAPKKKKHYERIMYNDFVFQGLDNSID